MSSPSSKSTQNQIWESNHALTYILWHFSYYPKSLTLDNLISYISVCHDRCYYLLCWQFGMHVSYSLLIEEFLKLGKHWGIILMTSSWSWKMWHLVLYLLFNVIYSYKLVSKDWNNLNLDSLLCLLKKWFRMFLETNLGIHFLALMMFSSFCLNSATWFRTLIRWIIILPWNFCSCYWVICLLIALFGLQSWPRNGLNISISKRIY